jgi:hypothetical protein
MTPEKSGGLNGSMQHWFGVYSPEFQRLNSFPSVEFTENPVLLGPIEYSRKD